jgi:hypothetical protein
VQRKKKRERKIDSKEQEKGKTPHLGQLYGVS